MGTGTQTATMMGVQTDMDSNRQGQTYSQTRTVTDIIQTDGNRDTLTERDYSGD